ncbi:MAG: hypothetical protein AABX48_03650 [Nanoarchaeota archaeon]
MARNLGDKINDCPLPVVNEETILEYINKSLRGDENFNHNQEINKFFDEQPTMKKYIPRLLVDTSSVISRDYSKGLINGMQVLYHMLRTQAIKDQTREYE